LSRTAVSPTLQDDYLRPRLSVTEAAEYCGVTERYMRTLIEKRAVRHYKVGLFVKFAPADLDAFLTANVREVAANAT